MKKLFTLSTLVVIILIIATPVAQASELKAGPVWGHLRLEFDNGEQAGDSSIGAGIGLSGDLRYLGANYSYNLNDKLKASLDLGAVDIDATGFDPGLSFEGGLSYKLDLELPEGTGVELQGKGYYTFIEDLDVMGGSIGGYASYDLNIAPTIDLKAYAGLSLHYQSIDYSVPLISDSDDIFPGFTAGLKLNITPDWSLESNISHVDEPILRVGTRLRF